MLLSKLRIKCAIVGACYAADKGLQFARYLYITNKHVPWFEISQLTHHLLLSRCYSCAFFFPMILKYDVNVTVGT